MSQSLSLIQLTLILMVKTSFLHKTSFFLKPEKSTDSQDPDIVTVMDQRLPDSVPHQQTPDLH